jgi:hypothetical protein
VINVTSQSSSAVEEILDADTLKKLASDQSSINQIVTDNEEIKTIFEKICAGVVNSILQSISWY